MTHKTFGETFRYPKLNKYEGLEGNLPLRYGDIFMGVEVEAERTGGRRGITIPGSFKSVQDGSLKVDGMEFVTVPIKLLYLEQELERLFGAIPTADFSTRTSIHVHMNARDFTIQNMMDFTILYTLFERNMYRYSGDRWNNNFCIPLQLAPINLINLFRYFSSERPDRQERLENDGIRWSKYLGYNLSPLTGVDGTSGRYGTIEFRQMKGNNNIPYIIDWCNLITCLKFAARSTNSSELLQSVMDNKSHELTESIFRQWTPLIIPNKDSIEDIKKANTFLKYCMRKGLVNHEVRRAPEISLGDMLAPSIEWRPIGAPRVNQMVPDPFAPEPSTRSNAGRPLPPIAEGETYQEYMRRIRSTSMNEAMSRTTVTTATTRIPRVRLR